MTDKAVTSAPLSHSDIRQLIRSHLLTFSPAERRVADVVLSDSLELLDTTVTELAERANTSAASVVRMCTSIGLRGYQELKTRLALEHVPATHLDSETERDGHNLTTTILRDFAAALRDTASTLDMESVNEVVAELLSAQRIQLAAVGTSAMLASDCATDSAHSASTSPMSPMSTHNTSRHGCSARPISCSPSAHGFDLRNTGRGTRSEGFGGKSRGAHQFHSISTDRTV